MPVAYAMSFLAIDKRRFNKLSTGDQEIVRDTLNEVYRKIDAQAQEESSNAMQALVKIGITQVEPDAGQFAELQQIMGEANKDMANEGAFPADLYAQMEAYLAEYRSDNAVATTNGQ